MSSVASLKNESTLVNSFTGTSGTQGNHPSDSSGPAINRQRTNRVCIGIALQVSGTDLNGQDFLDRSQTEHVSRNGACLVLNRFLGPDQLLTILRAGNGAEATVRVVGQVGIRKHGYVYGISLVDASVDFWGVQFPPTAAQTAGTSVRCTCCARSEFVELNEIEVGVLQANGILSRSCTGCRATTFWQALPKESGIVAPITAKNGKPSLRRSIRTSMKATACICQPTGMRDVANVLDVSRGGISFRTSKSYPVNSWIELAVPYTEGGANIFVAGRIVWERKVAAGHSEYGVQYVRN